MQLLERGAHLRQLEAALQGAESRTGRIMLVAGEAGVGKTALVQSFAEQAGVRAEFLVGVCDPLSTPRPLGPLMDVGRQLSSDIALLLDGEPRREQLFGALRDALEARQYPVVLVFEDVHWADEATLDLLQFLARRVQFLPVLLIATYRNDEVGNEHPLRAALGNLPKGDVVRRVVLEPLRLESVATLAADTGLDPSKLLMRTGGNPFYLTEVLAVPDRRLPDSVRDAVLARAAGLSQAGRRNLEVASVIGFRVEPWLLAELMGDEVEAAEECVSSGVLRSSGDLLAFRHELARETILGSLSPQRRLLLNRQVLAVLRDHLQLHRTDRLARLAHHAEEAGDVDGVLEFAVAAAGQASRLRAHREAAAQYARALRFADGRDREERAKLLEARAYECYLTSNIDAALADMTLALQIRGELGDREAVGRNLRWLSRLTWFAGRHIEARELGNQAVRELEEQAPTRELGWAYSNLSQLFMLGAEDDRALQMGTKAVELAHRMGDLELEVHARTNMGSVRYGQGSDSGRLELDECLRLALEHDFEEHAARVLTNLGSIDVRSFRLHEAEAVLARGIDYCTDHDLDAWRLYMLGWQASLLLAAGNWADAVDTAGGLLSNPRLPPVGRIQPLMVLGLVRARRDDPDAFPVLDEALELAQGTREVERLAPVVAARAEAFWLRGEPERGLDELRELMPDVLGRKAPWLTGQVAYWCGKLGEPVSPLPPWMAAPYALQLTGQWSRSAAAWSDLGLPYEAALALAEAAEEEPLQRGYRELVELGASAAARLVGARLRELGMRGPPTGPRASTAANPAGLTNRQVQVLELMSEGLSNVEIARALYRSVKTIDHHVSAVLEKLEVQNRTEAVRRALEYGLIGPADTNGDSWLYGRHRSA